MTHWPEFNLRHDIPVFGLNTNTPDSKISFEVYEHYVQRIAQKIFQRKLKHESDA